MRYPPRSFMGIGAALVTVRPKKSFAMGSAFGGSPVVFLIRPYIPARASAELPVAPSTPPRRLAISPSICAVRFHISRGVKRSRPARQAAGLRTWKQLYRPPVFRRSARKRRSACYEREGQAKGEGLTARDASLADHFRPSLAKSLSPRGSSVQRDAREAASRLV